MPDTLVKSTEDNGVVERFIDMGDGTKARMVVSMDRVAVAGGASTFRAISAATANAAVLKASAGIFYVLQATNVAPLNAVRTVRLYNQATAPVAGDVPAMTIVLPANVPFDMSRSRGVAFPNGLAIAISASVLDNALAAVGAGDVTVNVNFT